MRFLVGRIVGIRHSILVFHSRVSVPVIGLCAVLGWGSTVTTVGTTVQSTGSSLHWSWRGTIDRDKKERNPSGANNNNSFSTLSVSPVTQLTLFSEWTVFQYGLKYPGEMPWLMLNDQRPFNYDVLRRVYILRILLWEQCFKALDDLDNI